ncbi:PilW family protein [Bacillus sp. N9]
MKKLIKSEEGLTLVELLVVSVIGVIVLSFLTSIIMMMQTQYKNNMSIPTNCLILHMRRKK